jgi:hypothetical protein
MVYAFPTDTKLWAEYGRIRADSLRSDGDGSPATQFYREHRLEMDAGAIIAWPARHNPDEISAIQHAMNLRFRDEAAFFAEYQNEPLPESETTGDELTAEQIAAKVNRLRRAAIPTGCNHLTMFIDIQATLLFYVVVAWEDDFTGYIVEYGSYPDQKRPYFTLRDAKTTLAIAAKGTGLEGSIYAGLEALTKKTLDREWQRDDGAAMRIERPTPGSSCRATGGSSVHRVSHFQNTNARSETASATIGEFRMSKASGRFDTSSSIRTTGNRSFTPGSRCRWATVGASRSLARSPTNTECLPNKSPPNTGSRRKGVGEPWTNGSYGPSAETTTGSTGWSVVRSPRRFREQFFRAPTGRPPLHASESVFQTFNGGSGHECRGEKTECGGRPRPSLPKLWLPAFLRRIHTALLWSNHETTAVSSVR